MAVVYHEIYLPIDTESTFDYIVIKQGDAGTHKVRATLISNNRVYTIPTSGASYFMKFRKPDNNYCLVEATVSDNTISAEVTEEMLRVSGTGRGEFMIVSGSNELKTATFHVKIVKETYTSEDVQSHSDFAPFAALLQGAGAAASNANTAAAAANAAAELAEQKAEAIPDDYSDLVAEVEEVKADLDALEETVENIEPGLSQEAKAALMACFEHLGWDHDSDRQYYNALAAALNYTPTPTDPAKIFLYKFNDSLASAGNSDLVLTAPTPSYVTGKYGKCVQIGTSADNVPRNFNISSENMPRFDKDFTISLWFRNNASTGVTYTSFRFAKNISDNTVPMALAELTDLTYYNGYIRPNLTGNETMNQRYVGITLFHLWADYANMYNPGFVFFNKEHTKGYTFNLNNESRKILKQTWNHFAFCRKNNLCTIYINGLKACSFTYAGELYVPNQIVFGCALSQTDPNGITMQSGTIPNIDEFYINDRECIYNGEFTPAEITLS